MKHYIYWTLNTLVAVSLLLGSCQKRDDTLEQGPLMLSSNDLLFSNAEQQSSPIVVHNSSRWTSTENADWLSTEQDGDHLILKLQANQSGAERHTEVLVISHGTMSKIQVRQSSADVVVGVEPTDHAMGLLGGELLVDVDTNTEEWTVEYDAIHDWVKLQQFDHFVKVTVAPNEGAELREAKLYFRSGMVVKELSILQVGKGIGLQMPYLKPKITDAFELLNYERNTYGNLRLNYSKAEISNLLPFPYYYVFTCNSPLFSTVTYTYSVKSHRLQGVKYKSFDKRETLKSPEVREYLESEGFVLTASDELGDYRGVKEVEGGVYTVFTTLYTGESPRISLLSFKYEEVQSGSYSTPAFGVIPKEVDYLGNPNVKFAEIKALEEAAGHTTRSLGESKLYPGHFGQLRVSVNASERPILARDYIFDTGKESTPPTGIADQVTLTIADISLVYWMNSDGNYALTKEFIALMEQEGFKLHGTGSGYTFYYSAKHKLMMGLRVRALDATYSVLNMAYFKYDTGAQKSSRAPLATSIVVE